MRIDQFLKSGSHSDNGPEKEIFEWQTLDEHDQLTSEQMHEGCMAFLRGEPIPGILEYTDPVCARKNLPDSRIVDCLLEDQIIPFPKSRFLQIQHPNTLEWHLIDRVPGRITESSERPFKNVPVIYAD